MVAATPLSDAASDGTGWTAPAALSAAAAALLAVDPVGLGGCVLHAGAGPSRDAWLSQLRRALPHTPAWRRLPTQASDEQLLGGLDIAATLRTGQAVQQTGLLAQASGGFILAAMAERMPGRIAAQLSAALDGGENITYKVSVIALDEGSDDDARPPPALLDRLAFHLDLNHAARVDVRRALQGESTTLANADADAQAATQDARSRLAAVQVSDELITALAAAADALGVNSARALRFALRTLRASAALDARDVATADDASLAVQLVFAPRATHMPTPGAPPEAPDLASSDPSEAEHPTDPTASTDPAASTNPATAPDAKNHNTNPDNLEHQDAGTLQDQWIEAAKAAIPPGLLAAMMVGAAAQGRGAVDGRSGATSASKTRGRPLGARRGDPRTGARLALVDTLRAAAPWQAVRRAQAHTQDDTPQQIYIRREDLHVMRYQQRRATTMVFVIDASGSAALHRLAEAKGAVELLLADCYVRRDSVAVIGFRGRGAQMLLPPTRSLVRAKRSLAGLPGGGGTPLAAGIDAAVQLADQVARGGATPLLVFLTDGKANVSRDGTPGRAQAQADAQACARVVRAARWASVWIDTSPQPDAAAQALAHTMGARYVALPHARATELSNTVRSALQAKP